MNVSLSQIQAKLAEVEALRDDALSTLRLLALGRMEADRDMRTALVSKFDGYEREFWALVKIERELIAHGRAPQNELRTELRSDAPPPVSAAVTPANRGDAASGPRDAREAESLPPAGEVF